MNPRAPSPWPAKSEAELRAELGIPADAKRVVIVAQSSHWDPHWQFSFEHYYRHAVAPIFREALRLLDRDAGLDPAGGVRPPFRFQAGEVVFLERYWRDHPGDHERIRAHVASGRLRIVGGGWTSPDTLLVEEDALLADWRTGLEWSERRLGIRPTCAWQPDTFGHAPTLPVLLARSGYQAVAFGRVDGLHSPNRRMILEALGREVPLSPGSTADTLRRCRGADFVWRCECPDGPAEVLAHWMFFHYDPGDVLTCRRRWRNTIAGAVRGAVRRTDARPLPFELFRRRLAALLGRMDPLCRTPYRFVPVGSDFFGVTAWLPDLLAAWNERVYGGSGTWLTTGSFQEYADLVATRRAELPVLSIDPNPYWTGFYAMRPTVKEGHARGLRLLGAARRLGMPEASLAAPLRGLLVLNHHDGVTGTSPNPVTRSEQDRPLASMVPALESVLAARAVARGQEAIRNTAAGGCDGDTGGVRLAVVNPAGVAQGGLARLRLTLPRKGPRHPVVRDAAGRVLPSQLDAAPAPGRRRADEGRLTFLAPEVEAGGAAVFALRLEDAPAEAEAGPRPVTLDRWTNEVVLDNGLLRAVLARERGWGLVSLLDLAIGRELLVTRPSRRGPIGGADLLTMLDLGGLYRMGQELIPGSYRALASTAGPLGRIEARCTLEAAGPLEARVVVETRGLRPTRRTVRLLAGRRALDLEARGSAGLWRGLNLRFRFAPPVGGAFEHALWAAPLGAIRRGTRPGPDAPFRPTFHACHPWVRIEGGGTGGLGIVVSHATGVRVEADGLVDIGICRGGPHEWGDTYGAIGSDTRPGTLGVTILPGADEAGLRQEAACLHLPLMLVGPDDQPAVRAPGTGGVQGLAGPRTR